MYGIKPESPEGINDGLRMAETERGWARVDRREGARLQHTCRPAPSRGVIRPKQCFATGPAEELPSNPRTPDPCQVETVGKTGHL